MSMQLSSICPICGTSSTVYSGQCSCQSTRHQELLMNTAIPTITTHQQYLPGSYPTASPNSPYPISDEIQRYSETTNNNMNTMSDLNEFFSTVTFSSPQSPTPLPLALQHQHILEIAGLDDLGKAQEIVKERIMIEIDGLKTELGRIQHAKQLYYASSPLQRAENDVMISSWCSNNDRDENEGEGDGRHFDSTLFTPSNHHSLDSSPPPLGDYSSNNHNQQYISIRNGSDSMIGLNQVSSTITPIPPHPQNTIIPTTMPPHPQNTISLQEEDIIIKIQILEYNYRLLVFESTERNSNLVKMAQKQHNNQLNESKSLKRLLRYFPQIPSLQDFEQETQRYILGVATIAAYVGLFLIYNKGLNGFTGGGSQNDGQNDGQNGGKNDQNDENNDKFSNDISLTNNDDISSSSSLISSSFNSLFAMIGSATTSAVGYASNRLMQQGFYTPSSSSLDPSSSSFSSSSSFLSSSQSSPLDQNNSSALFCDTTSASSTWLGWLSLPWYSAMGPNLAVSAAQYEQQQQLLSPSSSPSQSFASHNLDFDTSGGTRRLDLTAQTMLGSEGVLDDVAGETYDRVYEGRTE